jgi:hypothetical protein
VTLADTPTTWPDGPSLSTLEVLGIFAGIPLLVIVVIFLLVYAPSWVHGPRYRPGQPWDGKREWFGTPVAQDQPSGLLGREATDVRTDTGESSAVPGEDHAVRRSSPGSGGASADW